ncbi:Dynamin central region-domain-containing protein [Kalaharituber pfeilii]|nr:Dynamin central region-domain-containing protein [Kalaharituber pfeilii]
MANLGEDLLGTVNKLQDLVFNTIGTDSGLDLPQIVVVGSQSSGKSSVLENIVGRDFLPRGIGIVTRRPLVLQLINLPDDPENGGISTGPSAPPGTPSSQEFAEFLHQPGRRYYDFSEVRKEIEAETARIAGNNKGINRQPINLKVYSPHVLNLTLVDLPGLTKIPIGDQPTDIEKQTRNLISEYIAKPNSIILAVSPANVDLVNSEALKLARQVDPQGKRTIGVLTKLDLMDHGTNALEILQGRVYPLKLGFIGVVNRSQQDIQSNKNLQDALKSEEEFFRHHPAYRNMAHRCGTQFLAKSLNTILMHHIRERLPDIKARLNTLMGQTQQELASYGDMHFHGKEHRGSLILQLMTRFASSFIASIDGTSSDISTKELCGGARIYYIFNSVFGNSLESIDPTTNLSVQDIRTAIRNSTGPRPSLFVPELAFDLLVKPQIRLLETPANRCVELVYEELIKICHTCGSNELSRFPRLQAKLIEVVSDLLRERLGPTSTYVESLIAIQRAYINTNHPNFLGAAAAMNSVISSKQEKDRQREAMLRKKERERRKPNALTGSGSVINGGLDTPDFEENERPSSQHAHRAHLRTDSRSHSPANFTRGDISQLSQSIATLNGRSSSPPPLPARFGSSAGPKDSFLNYFFGKDGMPAPSGSVPRTAPSESNFAQGFKRNVPDFPREPVNPINGLVSPTFDNPRLQMQKEPEDAYLTNSDEPALTEREQMETELIRRLISSYFNIVRETIQDQVPKAVMHFLVNHTKDAVQNRLVTELYREEYFSDLLYEDDAIKAEREKCEKLLQTYKEAAKIVAEV